MSKMSRVVATRIPKKLLDLIQSELDRRSSSSELEDWPQSRWILQAICDRLNHARRGRGEMGQWVIDKDDATQSWDVRLVKGV